MSILRKRRNNLEKPWFLCRVTEMLSFPKIGEKCCDVNFLRYSLGIFFGCNYIQQNDNRRIKTTGQNVQLRNL
jgi:hypothetical protein